MATPLSSDPRPGMSSAKKGLLIGCGLVLLLGLAAVVAIVLWLRAHGPGIVASGEAAQAAGAKAGADLQDAQCVERALADYARAPGVVGAVHARVWLGACLGTAQPTDGFCRGVPPVTEIMRSATWRVAACGDHGLGNDSTCPNILAQVQEHCGGAAAGASQAE